MPMFEGLEDSIQYAGVKGHENLFKKRTVAEQFCAEKKGRKGDCPKELKAGDDGFVDFEVYRINAKTKKWSFTKKNLSVLKTENS